MNENMSSFRSHCIPRVFMLGRCSTYMFTLDALSSTGTYSKTLVEIHFLAYIPADPESFVNS